MRDTALPPAAGIVLPLLLPLLLAACSADPAPPPASVPAVTLETAPGVPAPEFRLATVDGASEMALSDAVRAAGGRPLVLVLGASDCPYSTQEVDELAAASPGYAVLAVIEGSPQEVKASLPGKVPFPVLVDAKGETLALYSVDATPSIVLLDGTGSIAYRGPGGYIPPARVADMAARVARGEAVGAVDPAGG